MDWYGSSELFFSDLLMIVYSNNADMLRDVRGNHHVRIKSVHGHAEDSFPKECAYCTTESLKCQGF